MSEYTIDQTDEDDQDDISVDDDRGNPNMRMLRKKAKDYDALVGERDQYKRELEFFKAGIPDTPATRYFRRGYDGDLDVAAIRKAAAEAGFIDQDDQAEELDEELDALDRVTSASSGSSPLGNNVITPATYASWPREKRNAFRKTHPDLSAAIGRGEEVRATF
jgi:hypothetical protein